MINKVRHRVLNLSLGDTELRLLRVFASVVQYGGFSSAQTALGMTQATISTHMRHLEDRLGLRLCSRGRSGFLLTDEGASSMRRRWNSSDRWRSSKAASARRKAS